MSTTIQVYNSPSSSSILLLSVDNVRLVDLALLGLDLVNLVLSLVHSLLLVLLLPLGLFPSGAEVVAEPLLDACSLSESRPKLPFLLD